MSEDLTRLSFDRLSGWEKDTALLGAFRTFLRSAEAGLRAATNPGTLGIPPESFHPAFVAATNDPCRNEHEARAFFETFFRPYLLSPKSGEKPLITGYYQPTHKASLVQTERFRHPLYRQPHDLVSVEPGSVPGLPHDYAFARQTKTGLIPYFDRRAIDEGALEDRGLEVAWLESRVDVFFIHVQGSSLLELPDGRTLRVGYAAKSGHPFTGIGRYLIDLGEISADEVSMQTIRGWLDENPARTDEVLWRNRSYIFFGTPGDSGHDGPEGASGVNLVAGRSVAVDSQRHVWGTPIFISSTSRINFGNGGELPRLMIAQDTGSAIRGNCRADLFMGTGEEAGALAGGLKETGSFHLLIPITASGRL
nr:MltA domain-containing protein [Limoniibacter endophyticus]